MFPNYICNFYSQVPTKELEGRDKIVALFFFKPSFFGFQTTVKLIKTWSLLKDDQREAFQVVIVNKGYSNLSKCKAMFIQKFGCIPWYFLASCGRKLSRIFNKGLCARADLAGDLVVLESDRYQPFSYFAFKILERFGAEAYPFTLQRAVEFAKEKQTQLVLDQLLSPEAPLLCAEEVLLCTRFVSYQPPLGPSVTFIKSFCVNLTFNFGVSSKIFNLSC